MPLLIENAQALRPLGTQSLDFGATATTFALALSSKIIRINTTAAVCLSFDGGPASTASGVPFSADQTEYMLAATGIIVGAKARDSALAGVIGTVRITEC